MLITVYLWTSFEGCLFVSSFCLVSFGKIACILFADAGAEDLFTGFTEKGDACLIGICALRTL